MENKAKLAENVKCPKCGGCLHHSETDGYKYQCLECDEDFYSFEVVEAVDTEASPKKETIIQSIKRIEDNIYKVAYDDLSDYLQGVRDIINLVNGEENSEEIASSIFQELEFTFNVETE